jgi:very-short-patch-repair endonuclease
MGTSREVAVYDKPDFRPAVWRVRRAERAVSDKGFVPAAVWRVLRADAEGDAGVARIAAAQRGVVHRSQLAEAGLSKHAVGRRARTGRLFVVFRGVYSVGQPALEPLALETAALLYVGSDAVVSHGSAIKLWKLPGCSEDVHITVFGRNPGRAAGIRIHRVKALDLRDVRIQHGIPVTAPARTLIDFAARETMTRVEKALAEARALELVTDDELEAAMERCPGRVGVGTVRAVLAAERGPAILRSDAERRMRRLIDAADLPVPEFNAPLLGFEVDVLWRHARLIVEVGAWRFHGGRRSFESDRRRDQVLVAAGYRVIRVTWRQLTEEPFALVARIAQALALAAMAC